MLSGKVLGHKLNRRMGPNWIEGWAQLFHLHNNRGGHTGLFLEIPYETPESWGFIECRKGQKKKLGIHLLGKNNPFSIKNEVSDRRKSRKLKKIAKIAGIEAIGSSHQDTTKHSFLVQMMYFCLTLTIYANNQAFHARFFSFSELYT